MDNTLIIGLSIVIFTSIILLLVTIISILEKKLLPAGDINININDDESKQIKTSPGGSLLSALSSNAVFIPAACGGGGTCGMCRCQVTEGAGDILPTEVSFFTRAEVKDHWRLACQVKPKNDLSLKLPDEIFSIQKFKTKVRSNGNVATFIKELILDIDPSQKIDFEAGGYIQIHIPPYNLSFKEFDIEEEFRDDWDKYNVWDYNASNDEEVIRAYSMANYPAEGNIVMLNVRIATPPPKMDVPPGIGSSWIFNLKPGDDVIVSGPYGEFFPKETEREMCYIGGGAGMAPLRSHIFDLLKTKNSKRRITYWYGARSMREVFYLDEIRELEKQFPNFTFHLALSEPLPEDNWTGPTGFIHQVVQDEYLLKHDDPTDIEYYLCGPPMMSSAVLKMLDDMGVEKEMIDFDDFG